jgi:hypothetical protein
VDAGRERVELGSLIERPGEHIVRTVRVARLDDFEFDGVSFVKIDVEGHELGVLEGAAETIRRHHPVILMEIEQRHATRPIAEVFDWLAAAGYDAYFIDGSVRPIAHFSYDRHQAEPLAGSTSKYVNNFFFVPRGA